MNIEQQMQDWIREGVKEAIKSRLGSQYSSPVNSMVDEVIKKQCPDLAELLKEAIQSCVTDESFREEIKAGARKSLAKILVQRFGGELEKQVNALKSDPTTRARITLAIDEIVKGS